MELGYYDEYSAGYYDEYGNWIEGTGALEKYEDDGGIPEGHIHNEFGRLCGRWVGGQC